MFRGLWPQKGQQTKGQQIIKFFFHVFPKTFLSAERSVWVSHCCHFFVVAFFFSLLAFVATFWRAVRGPQNGPTAVQIGFRRSEFLTNFCLNFKYLKWEVVQKHYKHRGFKQNEGSNKLCQKWPIWKAVRGPQGGQFRDHIHVSFSDLHGGPLTACSVGPELSLKRLLSAERSGFFYFLWSLNWLSGKGSSGPAGGCPACIYIYIYNMAEASFSAYFLAFWKAKTAYFSHFEANKGKGKEQKGRPKSVVLFGRQVHFYPNFKQNFAYKVGRKRGLGHIQGVTLRLKPYCCINFLDVTLKLKPVSVLSPLELASNFSKGRALGIQFFGDVRPKRVLLGHFQGRRVKNSSLNCTLFGLGDLPQILAKVSHFSTELVRTLEKKTQNEATEIGHRSMPERSRYERNTVKPMLYGLNFNPKHNNNDGGVFFYFFIILSVLLFFFSFLCSSFFFSPNPH